MAGQVLPGAMAEALAKAAAGPKQASECCVPASNMAVPQCEEGAMRPQVTERSLCSDGVAFSCHLLCWWVLLTSWVHCL